MGHLGELRKRFTYVAVMLVVCVIVAFIFKDFLFDILLRPLRQNTSITELSTLGVTEGFISVLKVSVYAGLVVCVPFILYQFWAFVLPGLYENERRNVIPYMLSTSALFLGGVAFAYFIVLPVGLKFMVGYGADMFNQLLQADRYISFVSLFLLSFGIVFELPLLMMLLAWTGLIDYVKMRKVRKYAILVEAVVAAVFTPSQDPVSMCLMLIPLIILYEFGILLSKSVAKRKAKRAQMSAATETGAGDGDAGSAGLGGVET